MATPNAGLLGTYDPAKISVWIAGTLITGFGEEAVRITPLNQEYNFEIGIDGEICRWPTNDFSCEINISLLPVAPSNGVLQALLLADRATGSNIFSVLIKDVSQAIGDLFFAPLAWVKSNPSVVYRKGIELRSWPISCGIMYPALVGNQSKHT